MQTVSVPVSISTVTTLVYYNRVCTLAESPAKSADPPVETASLRSDKKSATDGILWTRTSPEYTNQKLPVYSVLTLTLTLARLSELTSLRERTARSSNRRTTSSVLRRASLSVLFCTEYSVYLLVVNYSVVSCILCTWTLYVHYLVQWTQDSTALN